MAPGQRRLPERRRAVRAGGGRRWVRKGAEWEEHPRPGGTCEQPGDRPAAGPEGCAGERPAEDEAAQVRAAPRRRLALPIAPAPAGRPGRPAPTWPVGGAPGDDESWASSSAWRASRQAMQLCFEAWRASAGSSSEESWAGAAEWQRYRDRLRCHFAAWSVARATGRSRGPGAPDDEAALLSAAASPRSQSCDSLRSADHEVARVRARRLEGPGGKGLGEELRELVELDFKPLPRSSSGTSLASRGSTCDEGSLSRRVTGDDSILGPDGHRYEVFYPSVGTRGAADTGGHADSGSNPTAEDYIGGVVAAMRSAMAARHPARRRLFDEVRGAAAEALGEGFERLAMVGSAALQIDTPASDVDAVAFTRGGGSAAEVLRRVAGVLASRRPDLSVDLVEYTRVPLLVARAEDGTSLDLTVNQTLPEQHVLWFRRQRELSLQGTAPCAHAPAGAGAEPEQSLEAAVLRCVKWWLWRRHVPASKEGGYPTLVWTLMALHALRCSVLVDVGRSADPASRNRRLLGALAAFFDRFAGHKSQSGTILFEGGVHSEFRPTAPQTARRQRRFWPDLSVLDPALVARSAEAPGLAANLAPSISPATQLLYAFELHRAARLSAVALDSLVPAGRDGGADEAGIQALRELFEERERSLNSLPTAPAPRAPEAALLLLRGGSSLELGLLRGRAPRPGWSAPFFHRRDLESGLVVSLCDVDEVTGAVRQRGGEASEARFCPHDFVGLAALAAAPGAGPPVLGPGELERWSRMREILREAGGDAEPSAEEAVVAHADRTCRGGRGHRQHARKQGCYAGQRDARLP